MIVKRLYRSQDGASAVEFALVVPVVILFLLGIIDAGRFIWNTNEVEKAVQIGTRWAVATDMLCTGLQDWSFAEDETTIVPQGDIVPQSKFSNARVPAGGAADCSCIGGTCEWPKAANQDAYRILVARMNQIYAGIGPNNVEVNYDWSGLGYSGDPNGSDVDPLVTVTVKDVGFRPIFLAGIFDFGLPDLSYTLTMEDGEGAFSN